VQKVCLEEAVRGVSIFDAAPTALEMIDPVATRILQLRRQVADNCLFIDLSSQNSRIQEIAYVLSKAARRRHELEAATRQLLVGALLIYPEPVVAASLSIKQEVAERRMVQADWPVLIIWDVENRVQIPQHLVYFVLWYT
jgi:hypothetical protein